MPNSFKVGEDIYDIPDNEREAFLKEVPNAIEVQSYIVGEERYDIPLNEVDSFIKEVPNAQLFKKKSESISQEPLSGTVEPSGTNIGTPTSIGEIELPPISFPSESTGTQDPYFSVQKADAEIAREKELLTKAEETRRGNIDRYKEQIKLGDLNPDNKDRFKDYIPSDESIHKEISDKHEGNKELLLNAKKEQEELKKYLDKDFYEGIPNMTEDDALHISKRLHEIQNEIEGNAQYILKARKEAKDPYFGMTDDQRLEAKATELANKEASKERQRLLEVYGYDKPEKMESFEFSDEVKEEVKKEVSNFEDYLSNLSSTDYDKWVASIGKTKKELLADYLNNNFYPKVREQMKGYTQKGLSSYFEWAGSEGEFRDVIEKGDGVNVSSQQLKKDLSKLLVLSAVVDYNADPKKLMGIESSVGKGAASFLGGIYEGVINVGTTLAQSKEVLSENIVGINLLEDPKIGGALVEAFNDIGVAPPKEVAELAEPEVADKVQSALRVTGKIIPEFAVAAAVTKTAGAAISRAIPQSANIINGLDKVRKTSDNPFTRGMANVALKGIDLTKSGITYEAAGQLFDTEEGEFSSGVAGKTGSDLALYLISKVPGLKSIDNPAVKKAVSIFGAGLGEVAEETAQTLAPVALGEKEWKDVAKQFEGEDLAIFLGLSFGMGSVMGGLTGSSDSVIDWAKEEANKLNPEQQKVFKEISGQKEIEQIVEDSKPEPTIEEIITEERTVEPVIEETKAEEIPTIEEAVETEAVVIPEEVVEKEAIERPVVEEKTEEAPVEEIKPKEEAQEAVVEPEEIKEPVKVEEESRPTKEVMEEVTGVKERDSFKEGVLKAYNSVSKILRNKAISYSQGLKKGLKEGSQKALKKERDTQKELTGSLNSFLKENRELIKKTSPKLIPKLTKLINNVKPRNAERTISDIENLLKDSEYDVKIKEGEENRGRVKKLSESKTVPANIKHISKNLKRIDPREVEDIDVYNEKISKIKAFISSPRRRMDEGFVSISDTEKEGLNDLNQYIEQQEKYIQKKREERLKEEYETVVGESANNLSFKEMQEVIEAVNNEDVETEETAEKLRRFENKAKREALNKYVSYKQTLLEDLTNREDLSSDVKEAANDLFSLDVEALNDRQKSSLIKAIDNLAINESTANTGNLRQIANVQRETKGLKEKLEKEGVERGDLTSFLGKTTVGAGTVTSIFDNIGRGVKAGSLFRKATGFDELTQANRRVDVREEEALNRYDDLISSIKDKDINSIENRYKRGIYAYINQYNPSAVASMDEQIESRRKVVEDTIDKLKSKKNPSVEDKAKAEALEKAFNETVTDKGFKISDDNKKIIDLFKNEFEEIKGDLFKVAEDYHNEILEENVDHTATEVINLGGSIDRDIKEEISSSRFSKNKSISKRRAGSTRSRKEGLEKLSEGKILNLDFDNVQMRKLREAVYDIETSPVISYMSEFMKSPESEKIIGSPENKEMVKMSLIKSLNERNYSQNLDPASKALLNFSNKIGEVATSIALASPTQVLTQGIPTAINTMTNLGTDAGLFFKAVSEVKNNPIFKKVDVGGRGFRKSALDKAEIDLPKGEVNTAINKLTKKLSPIESGRKKLNDFILKPLEGTDRAVAQASWLSFYLSDLKKQGVDIDNINWEKESDNINKEAAAYASQQVSRQQNISDPTEQPNIFKDKSLGWRLFKNIAFPFQSFALNAKVRMMNDVRNIKATKGKDLSAWRSLVGGITESAVFNGIKIYVLAAMYKSLAESFGADVKEDEEKEKKLYTYITKDVLFGGLGSWTEDVGVEMLNRVAYMAADTKKSFNEYEKKEAPFKRYTGKDKEYSNWGLYGVPIQKGMEIADNLDLATGRTYTPTNPYGKSKEVKTTSEMRDIGTYLVLSNIMSLLGVNFRDTDKILTLMKKSEMKNPKKKTNKSRL